MSHFLFPKCIVKTMVVGEGIGGSRHPKPIQLRVGDVLLWDRRTMQLYYRPIDPSIAGGLVALIHDARQRSNGKFVQRIELPAPSTMEEARSWAYLLAAGQCCGLTERSTGTAITWKVSIS